MFNEYNCQVHTLFWNREPILTVWNEDYARTYLNDLFQAKFAKNLKFGDKDIHKNWEPLPNAEMSDGQLIFVWAISNGYYFSSCPWVLNPILFT